MSIRMVLLVVLLLMAPCVAPAQEAGPGPDEKILYTKNSLYQYLVVADNLAKKERYIYNSKRDYMQGGISTTNPDRLIFEYYRMSFASLAFMQRKPGEVLFVGLGAGSMPRWFSRNYPGARVDVVEIDPEILDVAVRYFRFSESGNLKVHISDGRSYIKRSDRRYDMIFLDAYQTDFIPFHMTTAEFLREVRRSLRDGGVVVSNIVSERKNKYFHSMIRTYKEVFPRLYIFKGDRSANYIFIATTDARLVEPEDLAARAESLRHMDIDIPFMIRFYGTHRDYEKADNAELLTDDFAPVNLYRYGGQQ